MEYLVLDGYNVINAWRDIFNPAEEPLEDCRHRLLNLLSNYQGYKKVNVIIVFDAHLVKGSQENVEIFDNLTVVYTKENETADNYIERFVYKLGATNRIRVVTYDYLEQRIILSKGGIRVSPRELREEIGLVSKTVKKEYDGSIKKSNTIMSNLKPELLEVLEKMRRDKF